MADEIKYDSTQPVRSQASVNYTPSGLNDQNNLNNYNAQRENQIRDVYNAAQQNTNNGLRTAYEQNMSNAQAARDQITPQYQSSMNALSTEYERQRRNNNMQGAANGLNTGAGSQLALGQSMAYQAGQGQLARSENEAINEANRGIADLQRNYQNAMAEAVSQNNYQLASSLLDEYENQYNRQKALEDENYQRALQAEQQAYQRAFNEESRDYERTYNEDNRDYTRTWNEDERSYDRRMTEAQARASYGDFSAYNDIYGKDVADTMELFWTLQNPDAAWAAGKLKAEDYYALTGRTPNRPPAGSATGFYTGVAANAPGAAGNRINFGDINPATGLPYRAGEISLDGYGGGYSYGGGAAYTNGSSAYSRSGGGGGSSYSGGGGGSSSTDGTVTKTKTVGDYANKVNPNLLGIRAQFPNNLLKNLGS